MDDLACLMLQMEWGADEALADDPVDRRTQAPAATPLASTPIAPVAALPVLARAQALAAAAADVAALEQAVAGFDGCALRATATNLVFGAGDPASALMLIEGVPCAPEDRAGLPFAGPFLDTMLASVGLGRDRLRTASLLPWRPPGDRKPTEAEVAMCLPFLHRHVALVRPRFVMVFGNLAVKTLLPATPRRRPGWVAMDVPGLAEPVPALALGTTLHIQATASTKRDAWASLILLRRGLDGPHE